MKFHVLKELYITVIKHVGLWLRWRSHCLDLILRLHFGFQSMQGCSHGTVSRRFLTSWVSSRLDIVTQGLSLGIIHLSNYSVLFNQLTTVYSDHSLL